MSGVIAGVAVLASIMALGAFGGAAADDDQRRLSVTGFGSVSAAPDIARAVFGVTTQRPAAAEAYAETARAMSDVLAAVAASGVSAADVQTIELSLSPVYAGGGDAPMRIDGYAARQSVSVTVRALETLGSLLDAAARAGASDFDGVSFDVAQRRALTDAALGAAMEDAARSAALLAQAAGVRLGAAISVDQQGGARPEAAYRVAAMDAVMPVAAGSISVTATVSVVYAIE